jgi:hypothetical protein
MAARHDATRSVWRTTLTDYLLGLLLRTTLRHKHIHYTRRPHAQNLSHTLSLSLSLSFTHTHIRHTHTHKPKHKLLIHTNTTQYRFFGGGKCHNKTEFTHKLLTEKRWNASLKRFHSKTQEERKRRCGAVEISVNPRARRYSRFLETGDVDLTRFLGVVILFISESTGLLHTQMLPGLSTSSWTSV